MTGAEGAHTLELASTVWKDEKGIIAGIVKMPDDFRNFLLLIDIKLFFLVIQINIRRLAGNFFDS
jgi:hypothetical protein